MPIRRGPGKSREPGHLGGARNQAVPLGVASAVKTHLWEPKQRAGSLLQISRPRRHPFITFGNPDQRFAAFGVFYLLGDGPQFHGAFKVPFCRAFIGHQSRLSERNTVAVPRITNTGRAGASFLPA